MTVPDLDDPSYAAFAEIFQKFQGDANADGEEAEEVCFAIYYYPFLNSRSPELTDFDAMILQ